MRNELIDSLTRAFAAPASARPVWRVVASTATAGLWTLLGRTLVQPQSAYAAVELSPGCVIPTNDGRCPPNTTRQPMKGYVPGSNGCGPAGGAIKIPQGYGSCDYTPSCNNHDFCYQECFTPKDTCDENFRQQLYDACAAAYPGTLYALLRMGCYERAWAYYQAVSEFGDDAWVAAQQKSCECCQPQVYCNCNKKCYTDTQLCLQECDVTLGCNTGICGPATAEQCPG